MSSPQTPSWAVLALLIGAELHDTRCCDSRAKKTDRAFLADHGGAPEGVEDAAVSEMDNLSMDSWEETWGDDDESGVSWDVGPAPDEHEYGALHSPQVDVAAAEDMDMVDGIIHDAEGPTAEDIGDMCQKLDFAASGHHPRATHEAQTAVEDYMNNGWDIDLLELWRRKDGVVALACRAAMGDGVRSDTLRDFMTSVVARKLLSLEAPASRALMEGLSELVGRRTRVGVRYLVLPVLSAPPQQLGSAACEACTRLIKQGAIGKEYMEHLLLCLCGAFDTGYGICTWTDITLPVITAVLTQRPTLSSECVLCLLEQVEAVVEGGGTFEASPKLAALINTLVGRYKPIVVEHVEILRRMLSKCKARLLKAALNAACSGDGSRVL